MILATFDSPEKLLKAVNAAKKAGILINDVYTPFPVHGMDQAMGLKPSILSRLCFLFGFIGFLIALGFQYWVNLINWPMNIGGKPFHATPALIPIAFEIVILFAALGSVASFFIIRKMFPGKKTFLIQGATNNKFCAVLETGKYDLQSDLIKKVMNECEALELKTMDFNNEKN